MDKTLIAAGLVLVAFPSSAAAQGAPAAASCHVEVAKLMADPPAGIGELGAAIRELDVKLRPQVEEVNALKAQIARIEQRQAEAAGGAEGALESEDRAQLPVIREDPDAEELQRLQAALQGKQDQLKLDYAEAQRALVGPVQARVSERAQAFAAQRGCAELKMARAPDLAGLTTAGSQNVTGEFVSWYLANNS